MSDHPIIHIRAPELRPVLQDRAAKAGLDLSKYVRLLLASSLKKPLDIQQLDELKSDVASLRREIARIGSNLNQIAFRFNVERVDDTLSDHLQVTLEEVRRVFGQTMKSVKACEKSLD